MLSFEDFFIKKNIDLSALKIGEPLLYKEFELHYREMGEKSFDHTKKYWFNKLRMKYKLPEDMMKKPVVDVVKKEEIGDKGTEASTVITAAKPAGFKPKFKASVTKTESENPPNTATQDAEKAAEPKGFTPKFRPKSVKPVAEPKGDQLEEKATETSASEVSQKPVGFKPRFKAGVTKPKPQENEPVPSTEKPETGNTKAPTPQTTDTASGSEQVSKPKGFQPRFKAGVTKPTTPKEDILPGEEAVADKEITSKDAITSTENKPTGFKPRFKAGLTKVNKPKDED